MVKISVVIPVYNAEKFLDACLKSVTNQTYAPFEVILVDDGSSDMSGEICEKWACSHPFVKVHHQENSGSSAARNAGLRMASGDYICFVDADDIVSPFYIEKMVNSMCSADELVMCQYTKDMEGLNTKKGQTILLSSKEAGDYILGGGKLDGYLWNKIFSNTVIKKRGLFFSEDISIWEDLLFCIQYMKAIEHIRIIDDVLYFYRENDQQMTAQRNLKKSRQMARASQLILQESDRAGGIFERQAQKKLVTRKIQYAHALLVSDPANTLNVQNELTEISKMVFLNWIPVKQKVKYLVLRSQIWVAILRNSMK